MIRGTTVIKEGKITWPPPAPKISATPKKKAPAKKAPETPPEDATPPSQTGTHVSVAVAALAILLIGGAAPAEFMSHFTVFVLACFIGYQVIWNVSPSLHTPLMSVTNAISGIIVVGAMLQISSSSGFVVFLAAIGVLIASINIAGGFLVTQRMLKMFRK